MKQGILISRNRAARVLARGTFLIFLLTGASFAHASATSGTIDPAHKYAWGNVTGYVNFAPTNGGLTITDSGITGYAWSGNTGWINFDTAQSGVTNNGNGTLGGFAWDEGAGWVNFAGVTIDSSGQFHGLATGGTVNGASYAINFDCSNCSVVTDWRPVSARVSPASPGSISPIIITTVIPPPPTLPSSASSTAPTKSPSPTTSGVSGKNTPGVNSTASGAATSSQGFVSNPSSLTSTTTTTHAATSVEEIAASPFFNFIRPAAVSVGVSLLALILLFVLYLRSRR